MNADDPRRGDVAELARLLPAPAERELPAGRQHTLKEHLISELRLAASPAAGRPATRRRRMPAIVIAAAGAAALAAALVLALLPANTPGASPAAVRLLAKIATAAARQPAPPVRNSQFWYIKSWVAYQGCNRPATTAASKPAILEKPHERQIWQSVSNLCVTGLLREYGQDTSPWRFAGQPPALPRPGRRARPHLPVPAVAAHRPARPAQPHRAADARAAAAARRKPSPPSATCCARRSRRLGSAPRSTGPPP